MRGTRLGVVGAMTMVAAIVCRAAAQCDWLPGEGYRGVNSDVYSMVTWDPDGPGPEPAVLVVAGSMRIAGGTPVDLVSTWNGSDWAPLGIGAGGVHPQGGDYVTRLVVVAGDLYAAVRRSASNDVLRWNGIAWQSVVTGVAGGISVMAEYRGDLVVGGGFASIGGVPANRIARWNGSAWSALGSGVAGTFPSNPTLGPYVYALHAQADRLIVGGIFTSAGGHPSNCIATWDGAQWIPWAAGLGPDSFNQVPEVTSITEFQGQTTIAGMFSTGADGDAHVAMWNGTTWAPLGTGVLPSDSWTLAVYESNLFVAGIGGWSDTIARWTGQTWERPGGGADQFAVWSLAEYRGELIAGGEFGRIGQIAASKIARWDGTQWRSTDARGYVPMGHSSSDDYGMFAMLEYGGDLIAGGTFVGLGDSNAAGIARFDATGWHELPPVPASIPVRLDLFGAYILTPYQQRLLVSTGLRIVFWDGQTWSDGPRLPWREGGSYARAILEHDKGLFAGGLMGDPITFDDRHIMSWNGTSWSALGSDLDDDVYALASFNGDLIAAGTFTASGSLSLAHIARWDGSAWSPLGAGLDGDAYTLVVYQGDLIAAGEFTHAGGTPASNVARWDGHTWTPLGSGLGGQGLSVVRTLSIFENNLVAGGRFTLADGAPAQNIARWDGRRWSPLGSGVGAEAYPFVQTLAGQGDRLFVGGFFTNAGSGVSVRWARWTCAGLCYANCDASMTAPVLNVNDFICFLDRFAAGDSYANCDGSTTPPVLNVADFSCFLQRFALGCP